ncbi:hypothetical protein [Mesorhizobium tianshanense]|uniref:Uncharacterized protein n=1 Tax=Mesorhizobium tianshanense TaxID=39844 RepID=A0A562NDP3_9HYPH|nr:hypothetical protein [Mesorhizobium tianshanense]TWI30021.1 hypothetical protein IQ26_04837 [Mesorhizobium tianshanense]
MNAHATVTERPAETWKFELGQMVTHRDQPMPSLVMMRHKAGRRGLRCAARQDKCEVRDLMILGEVLLPA